MTLRDEINECFEVRCRLPEHKEDYDELYCCQKCMMQKLEQLIAREREAAVQEKLALLKNLDPMLYDMVFSPGISPTDK